MIIKRIINTMLFLSVLNSVYLSYIYLEAFMLGKLTNELESNFASILYIPVFIIAMVFIIDFLKDKFKKHDKKAVNIVCANNLISNLLFLSLAPFCLAAIFMFLKTNSGKLLSIGLPTLIEIIIICFTIGKEKGNAIFKLCGFIFFWVCVGCICFSLIGIFIQYLGYEKLDDSSVRLLFAGVFYHLLNACFLFYSFLPKNLTQWDFKK
jgi:hypothetical protein